MVLVSVIIPTYNNINNLFKAVDSVVDQTFKDLEIIIIDNCSNQREYNLLEFPEENITVIKNEEFNNSPNWKGLAKNIGIEKGISEMVSFDLIEERRK